MRAYWTLYYKDTTGKEHTLSFSLDNTPPLTGADLASKLKDIMTGSLDSLDKNFEALNADSLAGLKEIFSSITMTATADAESTLDVLNITATGKNAGSDAVGLQSVTIKQREIDASGKPVSTTLGVSDDFDINTSLSTSPVGALITQAPTDAATKITFSDLSSGSVYTFGNHSFELKDATDYKVNEGNTRVTIGKNDAETLNNLVAAMKSKGITSAYVSSATDTDKSINVTKPSELNKTVYVAFEKTMDIKTESLGVAIGTAQAVNGTFEFTATAATDNTTEQKLGIGYKDADGNAKSIQISYIGDNDVSDGAANIAKAMADAINANAETKDIFKATVDGTGKVTLEALGGKEGAIVNTVVTTDTATNAVSGFTAKEEATRAGKTITLTNTSIAKGDIVSVGGKEYQFIDKAEIGDASKIKEGATAAIIGADSEATAANLQLALANDGIKADMSGATLTIYGREKLTEKNGGLSLQVGDTNDTFQKVTVSVEDMSTKSLGIDGIDISTEKGAGDALAKINDAIKAVSTTRSNLGALQNRLDHTINNLGVTTENITAAESRIRDVDMAKEMMDFTKNNILTQAAQSMLAQANQIPQGVLQLLQ